jgi:hypothetical protein
MNTRHYRRISRKAAEQLLDGTAADGPDRLVTLLAAAAAPGREHELTGEQIAVAAFEANHLAPDANSRSEQMLKSPLARILTTKIIAAALLVTATGGVALAASTGTFSGSAPNSGGNSAAAPALTPPSPGAQASPASSPSTYVFPTATPTASASGTPAAAPAASAAATASASAGPLPQGATALCRALISQAAGTGRQTLSQAQQGQALASSALPGALNGSEFTALIKAAQSATAVPDYCALVLDLPQLPQPGDLTQLPVTVLAQLLTQVPAATLAQDLTSLPSSTLSALLAELPASTVSSLLTELPSSVVTQLLTELPSAAVTQLLTELPSSVVSQLLNELPTSALSGVLSGLPSSLLSGLPSSLLSGL